MTNRCPHQRHVVDGAHDGGREPEQRQRASTVDDDRRLVLHIVPLHKCRTARITDSSALALQESCMPGIRTNTYTKVPKRSCCTMLLAEQTWRFETKSILALYSATVWLSSITCKCSDASTRGAVCRRAARVTHDVSWEWIPSRAPNLSSFSIPTCISRQGSCQQARDDSQARERGSPSP